MSATVSIGNRRVGMLSLSGITGAGCHTRRVAQGRTVVALLAAALLSAGCGGGGPKTDAGAITQVVKDAAKAAADGDGDKACGYLTPDAQRQVVLQTGTGVLGQSDCATSVKRAQFVLTPLDKQRIKSLTPTGIQVNGTTATATVASDVGAPAGQGMSLQLQLQKAGSDWKISSFVSEQGLPGG